MTILAYLDEMTQKKSFGYYKMSNYAKRADLRKKHLSDNGLTITISAWFFKLIQKRNFGCYEMCNYLKGSVYLSKNGRKWRLAPWIDSETQFLVL